MKALPIFRQDAVLYAAQGRVRPFYTPLQTNYLWVMVVMMVLSMVATGWLITQHFVRYQTVIGWVEPAAGVQTHRSPVQGRIVEQLVNIGQTVEAGDVLMLVSPLHFMSNGLSVFDAQRGVLDQQQQTLLEQQVRQAELDDQKQQRLVSQLAGSSRKLALFETAKHDRELILQMANQQYDRAKILFEQGHVAAASLLDMQEKIHHLRLQMLSLEGEFADQQSLHVSLEQQLASLATEQALNKSRHEAASHGFSQQMIDLQGKGYHAIVAAQSGVVDSIAIHVGDEVRPGQALLNILPHNARLIGVMHIPVQAAGFVSEGQPVELRYSAYPYQKYGVHHGIIEQLNDTPNADTHGEFVYTAKVALEETSVLAHGKRYQLKTGMSFEADVVLSRRSFAEWLFEPLYSLRGGFTR
ncbi:MAG TPA: HlyD family efflux transporter periplasmic adaptor subunit [Pseudomonadales bacterium]|nr:HlyD family efflux transporter periplasmic adaptor subunit [Pseudomonadales bacterium]